MKEIKAQGKDRLEENKKQKQRKTEQRNSTNRGAIRNVTSCCLVEIYQRFGET